MKKTRKALKRKAVCFLLISSMLMLPGCGSTKATQSAGDNKAGGSVREKEAVSIDTGNMNAKGTVPILKNKVTLKILLNQDTNIEDFETNDYTKKLEEAVNVDLNFEFLPAGTEGDQKLAVMIASDSELPDMICRGLTDLQTYTYGSQGYLLPLNEMTDQISVYLKKYLESEDGQKYKQYINSPDGNMYAFPRIVEDLGNDWDNRLWINKTWLDKLGLKKPVTTDEYYEVLKHFRDDDPNGNGKADEIPLLGDKDGWNQNIWPVLMNAFTYSNKNYDYMQVEKGKLQVAYTQDAWRDGLKYMHKLSDEGLLSPLTFTQDQNQFKQIIENKDIQLVGAMTAGSMSVYQVDSKRKEDMSHLAPLTGPDGVCYTSYNASGIPTYAGFITKDCKDPAAAYMVFDYMYQTDMIYQGRFGIKDVDWKDPDPSKPGLYESLGYEKKVEYINPIWGTLQNHQWGEVHPTARTYDMICGQVWNGNPYDSQYMTSQAVPEYINKIPDETVQRILYLPEEADEIADIKSTLGTYRDEAAAAFITGTRPLSDWDKYIQELNDIGLQKYLEVSQKAYDRMLSNK
ncbi:extracellular solute-binding protein [Anaerocolumna sp. MB42-C2]|uniref:extracellular solute-binding protein n=1 Tax=Anaerocolumna sp. MB42-C2 TaxID=3070997 RepID=UPI0027E147DD|nr:extracellular solute-binding protein [Anaerocolumna sp. MB42-C2]WMJ86699.1 extracellular solute-binding protein [Anaerocolumna sp. MB42-C2]